MARRGALATLTAIAVGVAIPAARAETVPGAAPTATAPATTPRDSATSAAARAEPVPATAPGDSTPARPGPRVPGTSLHLGGALEEVVRQTGASPGDPNEASPTERVFAGPLRFFGLDAHARLFFGADRRLARAEFEVPAASERQREFVEDELLRQGYHRSCMREDEEKRVCDWSGRVFVHLESDTVGISARIAGTAAALATGPGGSMLREDPSARMDRTRLADLLADPTPILPDTLSLANDAPPGRSAPPALIKAIPAAYSDAIRARGISGIVTVLALVGVDGFVVYAKAADGPHELRSFAIEAVDHYQFGVYRVGTTPTRFWVWIPVRFII